MTNRGDGAMIDYHGAGRSAWRSTAADDERTVRRRPMKLRKVDGAWVALAAGVIVTSCSSSGGGAGVSAHDSFAVLVGATSYTYDCPMQAVEKTSDVPAIITTACGWPTTNPGIEIDFVVQQGLQRKTPLNEQTYDLSSVDPSLFAVVASLQTPSGTNDTIYSSWSYPNPMVAGPTMITTPGTVGQATIHTFDPSTGHLDVSLRNVTLPQATNVSGTYPGAPAEFTIVSAEIVR
jgi:hypothetical protein